MHIFQVKDKKVVQCWKSGKTLEQLKEKFPNIDLREGVAENGQIEVEGEFVSPPARVKDDNELDEETLSAMGSDFKRIVLRALKEINQSDSSIFSAKTKASVVSIIDKLKTL